MAYEIVYLDGVTTDKKDLPTEAVTRFFSVDPRELILFYDRAPEPKKKIGIRFYPVNTANTEFTVEVYYPDKIETYDMKREGEFATDTGTLDWGLTGKTVTTNFFDAVPVAAYYFGDDMLGIIEPVLPLIDDYDLLVSDSVNEFDRFAHAYLKLVKFSLSDPIKAKVAGVFQKALRQLKKRRVFENLPSSDAVSFLTKDIPSDYIQFMTDLIRNEIHIQSHVPDFTDKTFASEISGVAVERLLFDFENIVSSAEADFDVGLGERFELMNTIYKKKGGSTIQGDPAGITIDHRRNLPSNLAETAGIAQTMKETGFSDWLVADIMPDPVIPDIQQELDRQEEDRQKELARELVVAEAEPGELDEE